MTSTLINFIVEKYLANILEIDTSQTNASIWSGTVEMQNVKIKREIFQNMNLPYLELVDGYVGKLNIQMSMPRFYLYPIKVSIDKVFFHARQKDVDKLNQKEEIEGMETYKNSKLLSQEELSDEVNQLKNESPGMIQQIINNLNIDIGEIVFRFDDSVSYPKVPYSLGMVLRKMIIKPTNEKFELPKEDEQIPYSEVNHRLIRIEKFSIYLDCYQSKEDIGYEKYIDKTEQGKIPNDLKVFLKNQYEFYSYCMSELYVHMESQKSHQYLLHGLDMDLKISMNDNVNNGKPKTEVSLVFPGIDLAITLVQINTLFKVLAYINLNSYYRLGIAQDYYKRTLTDDEKETYMKDYLNYYKAKYVDKIKNTTFPENLKTFEVALTYEQIQSMRSASLLKLGFLNSVDKIDKEIKKLESAWFGVDHKRIAELKEEREKILLQEKQINSNVQEQLKKKTTTEVDEYFNLPDEYILYNAILTIHNLTWIVYDKMTRDNTNSWKFEEKIVEMSVDEFSLLGQIKKKGQFFSMSLGNFQILQPRVKNKNFVKMIASENSEDKTSKILYIEFENNPKLENSNYRLKMETEKGIYLVMNLSSLQYIQNKIITAMSSSINFTEISSYAKGEVSKYIQKGYVDRYMSGDYQHFNLYIDISIKSPILILPQNINDPRNNKSIYCSLGLLTIRTALPPRQSLDIDYKECQKESLMYDKYYVDLKGIKMSTMTGGTPENNFISGELMLIKHFDLSVMCAMIIEAGNKHFDNMIIEIEIENVVFYFTEWQILFLIKYLENMYKEGNELNRLIEEEKKNTENNLTENEKDAIKKFMKGGDDEASKKEEKKEKEEKDEEKKEEEFKKNPFGTLMKGFFEKKMSKMKDNKGTIEKKSNSDVVLNAKKTVNFVFKQKQVKLILAKNYPDGTVNNYLDWELNVFQIETYITENGDMLVKILIENILLFDNDLTLDKKPLVSENFRCLVSSKKTQDITSFIDISYLYLKKEKPEMETFMTMDNLVLCTSYDSLERMYKFLMYYYGKYNEMIVRVNQDSQNEINAKRSKQMLEESKKDQEINFRFFEGVKKNIAGDLKKSLKDILPPKDTEKKEEGKEGKEGKDGKDGKPKKSIWSRIVAKQKAEKNPETTVTDQKSKTSITFFMRKIEMLMPMDPLKNTTPIFAFNYDLSYTQKSNYEYKETKNIKTGKILRRDYSVYDSKMNVMLYKVDFDIVRLIPTTLKVSRNPITERLLSNFRMSVMMKSYSVIKNEVSVFSTDIIMEPVLINIGFRQIRRINEFYAAGMKFYYEKMKELYIPLVEFRDEEEISLFTPKKKLTFKQAISRALFKKKIMDEFKERLDNIKASNRAIGDVIKTNTDKFNSYIDVNFRLDKMSMTIYDNTMTIDKRVLLDFEITNILTKYISNSDPGDGVNMGNAIVEMVSGKQVPIDQYNIGTLYQYANITFSLEVLYYNISLSELEPFIEPFSLKLEMAQVAKMTRKRIDMNSNQMMNIDLSANSLKIFNTFMIKYYEDESKWWQPRFTEEDFKKSEFNSKILLSRATLKEGDLVENKEEEVILEFKNNTGVDVVFWFESNKEIKNKIIDKGSISYTITSLLEAKGGNKSRILGDKFSFSVMDSSAITGLDYSCNNYTNFRVELNVNGKKRFVEVSAKIKTAGIIKTVLFESSVAVTNDTIYDELYLSSDVEEIKLIKNRKVKIPLTWMIEDCEVYLRIGDEKKKLYENLSDIGANIEVQKEKKKKKKKDDDYWDIKENNVERSPIFDFTINNENVFLCVDYIALVSVEKDRNKRAKKIHTEEIEAVKIEEREIPDDKLIPKVGGGFVDESEIDFSSENTEVRKKIFSSFDFEIVVRPTVQIINEIPFDITCSFYDKFKEEHVEKKLVPIAQEYIYSLTPKLNEKLVIMMNYYDNHFGSSFSLDELTDLSDNLTMLLLNDNSSTSFQLKIKKIPFDLSKRFNPRYMKYAYHSTVATQYVLYFEYLITNRLKYHLLLIPCDPKSSTSKENKNEIVELLSKKVNLVSFFKKETKVMIKSDDTIWSKKFDINTQGIDGVVSLDKTIDVIGTNPKEITKEKNKLTTSTEVAVKISKSLIYKNSTIVVFEPRYIIINHLDHNISYKQEGNDNEYKLAVGAEEEMFYKTKKKIYRICLNGNWSGPFDVENVEDYDLAIKIDKADIEKFPKTNVFTYDGENYFLLIRVINKTYDNALIYIMLTFPRYPYMEIDNRSDKDVKIYETKKSEGIVVRAKQRVPFVWESTLDIKNAMYCEIYGEKKTFSFSKFDKTSYDLVDKETNKKVLGVLSVSCKNLNSTRCLKIETFDAKPNEVETIEKLFFLKRKPAMTRVNISLKGMGMSIIDDKPEEIFFISFYGIDIFYSNNILKAKNDTKIENTENIIFYLKNFQIDYCLNDSFKNIIFPKMQIIPCNEEYFHSKDIEIVPFMSLLVTRQYTQNIGSTETIMKYPQIDFTMQEFNFKIEQFAVNSLLAVITDYLALLTFYQADPNAKKDTHEPLLDTEVKTPITELCSENENKNMILINYLLISGLKFNLTLRIDISHYNIGNLPKPVLNVIGVFGNSLCRITESPLKFKEMLYENVFIDFWKIISLLTQNYTKQGIMQIYKILGSSDLIGNPTKLIDNIGTGFIELFNEPRKGFLKGPSQFGKGLARGFASLISNVVGGSFDAIGKITGTLLSATRTLQGKKHDVIEEEENEPQNILAGTFEGVKGSLMELGKGFSGIFLNPYRQAKTDGVKGFFKGLGTGLLGAIISPVSALLKLGNSIAVGMKNTARMLNRTVLKTVRFRHPFVIPEGTPIRNYDEGIAEAKELMYKLLGKTTNKILYEHDFLCGEKKYSKKMSTVILTDLLLVVVYDSKKVIFKLDIMKVVKVFVHFVNGDFIMLLKLDNEKTRGFKINQDYAHVATKLYDFFHEMTEANRGDNNVSVYSDAVSKLG